MLFPRKSNYLLESASRIAMSGVLGVAATVAFLGVAQAQDASPPEVAAAPVGAIETVVVTAQKRAENVQEVPMSITAYSGDDLMKGGIDGMQDLGARVPSFSINPSNNLRNTSIYIRGIGSSGTNPGIEPSVGIFLDGVYLPNSASLQSDLADIQSVEFLRGPQGTLYGRNTPVGAVNMTTREPTHEREGQITAGLGDYDLRYMKGYYGGSITDTLAGRFSFWGRSRAGYEKNLYDGRDVNDYDNWGGRARLTWTPSDDWKFNFIGYYGKIKQRGGVSDHIDATGPGGIATPGFLAAMNNLGRPFRNFDGKDHVVDAFDASHEEIVTWGASLQADWTLGSGHTLTSITSHNAFIDTIDPMANAALPMQLGYLAQRLDTRTTSQEFRLASPTGEFLDYLVGLYLYKQDSNYQTLVQIGAHANRLCPATFPAGCAFRQGDAAYTYFHQRTNSAAMYGKLTANFTEEWSVTGGLRFSYDDKKAYINHYISPGPKTPLFLMAFGPTMVGEVNRSENKLTWSANTQYKFTPDMMAFATVSTGFKSGGFNASRLPAGAPVEFEEETSITYEAGIKSMWFDNRLLFNATIFHMELKDFQEAVLNPITNSGFIVGNAGDRRVRGIEMDFQARPIDQLLITGSAAYLNAKYLDYTTGSCYPGRAPDGALPGTCSFNGMTPFINPRWKLGGSATWTQPIPSTTLEWFVRGDVTYTGAQFMNPTLDPRSREPSSTIWDARIGLQDESGSWGVTAWVKNLTDEDYYVARVPTPLGVAGSGGGALGLDGYNGWYAPPRTIGVETTFRF